MVSRRGAYVVGIGASAGNLEAREHFFDNVPADIGLVARRVRSNPVLENVVLIALTGHGPYSDRTKALEVGFNAHVVKPVKFEELMKLLTK
ncbi:hypothetical protein BH11MYX2_BH11MYX2_20100 [soil metagenome]